MQGHRNIQSAYDTYGPYDQHPASYHFPSSQAMMGRDSRGSYYSSSDFDFGDQYDLYQRDRLPTMRERFAYLKFRQAELRNVQAGHDQPFKNSSSTSPDWARSRGGSYYDHTRANSIHDHHNRQGLLAGDLGHPYSDTHYTPDYYGAGTSYPRGGGRTGFSLGEALPRSMIYKNDLLRSRASSVSSRFCLQNCQPQPFSGSNRPYSGMAGLYGTPYAGRPWLNDGMAGRLRRASSGTCLSNYGCGY